MIRKYHVSLITWSYSRIINWYSLSFPHGYHDLPSNKPPAPSQPQENPQPGLTGAPVVPLRSVWPVNQHASRRNAETPLQSPGPCNKMFWQSKSQWHPRNSHADICISRTSNPMAPSMSKTRFCHVPVGLLFYALQRQNTLAHRVCDGSTIAAAKRFLKANSNGIPIVETTIPII